MNMKQLSRIYAFIHPKEVLLSSRRRMKQINFKYYSTGVAPAVEEEKPVEKLDKATLLKNYVNPLRNPDHFEVRNLFTIKELFDARVYLGHREDTLHPKMRPYILGSRLGHLIFDLPTTAEHLRRALNFAAHIAYRDGIILFASQYHQHCLTVEQTAIDCKEFAHTRPVKGGLFTDSVSRFRSSIRLPDLVIFLTTLNTVLNTSILVHESAKMNIPTIGIVDTNSDPTIITYPVPGNDDSPTSIELYCKLFKTAILKGKEARKKDFELISADNKK